MTYSKPLQQLADRIADRSALVAIVGLGYVGLPLVRAMHEAGFRVLGYDRDKKKIDKLDRGENYLEHLGDELAPMLAASDRFQATTDSSALAEADAIVLCVPTPLGKHNEPDMSFIVDSTNMVAETLRPGQLITLESTTYPGTTRGDCLPILEAKGLKCGEDFALAYSPEREDPGREDQSTHTIPKLVGGIDAVCTELATAMYRAAIERIVPVETAEVAEAAKLLENIYRAVNIALVNELKPVMTSMGIDIWQVIQAAATKPFGFQAFYPGPGLGGHCIPIDPFYLTWKAREFGHHTRFIELAGEVNNSMPDWVVQRAAGALNQDGKPLKGSDVLILGIAYKPNVDDIRETPAAEIVRILEEAGAKVSYHDPHVAVFPSMRRYGSFDLASEELTPERLANADCVMVVTDHAAIPWDMVAEHAKLVVDTRNTMAGRECAGRVVRA